jgi:GNAT superfamily N-acetyltransferase
MTSAAALGFRSELIFHCASGELIDLRAAHGCRLIRTPANPTYWWGNYLLFEHAPRAGDHARWSQLFEQLIAVPQPGSTHRAFGWLEDDAGDATDFLADGYELNDAVVMQARTVPPVARPVLAATLRLLAAQREWDELIELRVATREPHHGEDAYRELARRKVAAWRSLASAGQGAWFGAFVDVDGGARLAAALGIYVEREPVDGERLARYQSVMTHPSYRRLGLCRALLALAGQHARERLGADRLIIVAMAGEMPERLYAGAGFSPLGLQRGLERRPPG